MSSSWLGIGFSAMIWRIESSRASRESFMIAYYALITKIMQFWGLLVTMQCLNECE